MVIPIFYAHPDTKGHNSTILNEVTKNLKQKNIQYKIIDLYNENYNPILSKDELYTSGNRFLDKDTKKYQKILNDSKQMIFIHPIWWGSMPSILKGFFDRTLTSPFAFKYEKGIPIKNLKGRKAIIFQTMGSPRWYQILTGNRPKKAIAWDILKFVGIKSKVIQFNNAKKFTDQTQKKIERKVEQALKNF